MKNIIFTTIAFLFISNLLTAQVAQGFNYQGVARDQNNQPYINQAIALELTIQETNGTGIEYREVHFIQTSDLGVFNVVIGKGDPIIPKKFEDISWGTKQLSLRTRIDLSGTGNNWQDAGRSELLSVPYAQYAFNASGSGGSINITGQNGIVVSPNGTDYVISLSTNVDTDKTDDVTKADQSGGDISGTFSNLQLKSNTVGSDEIVNGSIMGADLSSMNAQNGQVLKYNGSSWAPANDEQGQGGTGGDGWGTQTAIVNAPLMGNGTGNNPISLQNNSINATHLSQMGAQNGQVLKYNGTTWGPANDEQGGGGSGNITINSGNGISVNPTSGSDFSITNTAPDQVVTLTGAGNTTVSGSYPNFTISSSGGSGNSGPWSQNGSTIYYNTGNVGIGITNNANKLAVNGNTGLYGNVEIEGNLNVGEDITTSGITSTDYANFQKGLIVSGSPATTQNGSIRWSGSDLQGYVGNTWKSLTSGGIAGSGTASYFAIFNNSNTLGISSMSADNNGRIGIGVLPSSQYRVNVEGAIKSGTIWISPNFGTTQSRLEFSSSGVINSSSSIRIQSASQQVVEVGNGTSTNLVIKNNNVGISTNEPQDDLHIKQQGTTGIRFEAAGNSTDRWAIGNTGGSDNFFTFDRNGTRRRYFDSNGATYVPSDQRLKENIKAISPTLSKLLQITPSTYNYKNNNGKKSIGFIAQEVRNLFPELTSDFYPTEEDEKNNVFHIAVNYEGFAPVLVQAIKEQQVIIDSQAQKISDLEARLSEMQSSQSAMAEAVNELKSLIGHKVGSTSASVDK